MILNKYLFRKNQMLNYVNSFKNIRVINFNITNSKYFSINFKKFSTQISNGSNLEENNSIDNNNFDIVEIKNLERAYPAPKNTLSCFFQKLSSELKTTNCKLTSHFKPIPTKKGKHEWQCTYKLNWPFEYKAEGVGLTKQDASKKAALKALYWLKQTGKITTFGQPVIYDHDDIKKLKQNIFKFELNEYSNQKLDNIIQIYDKVANLIEEAKHIEYEAEDESENFQQLRRLNEHKYKMLRAKLKTRPKVELPYKLPIENYRNDILTLINENNVVVIKGEPGCGKSTQVGQYILENFVNDPDQEACEICISEPRRIAAITLAEMVSRERNEKVGETVGYQVRLENEYNAKTNAMLYCTSGILLKRIQSDPELKSITHVILDEAHERDVNTDVLMVLLKQALDRNPKLKLIIMSATIDSALFSQFYNNAPVINIPGRVYPVKQHFLEDIMSTSRLNLKRTAHVSSQEHPFVYPEEVANFIIWLDKNRPTNGSILCFLPGWQEISKTRTLLNRYYGRSKSHLILPLHSKLSSYDQKLIFDRPDDGVRKIILSTNIAETSVTINDVVYVVDTGSHNEIRINPNTGLECMGQYWISKSSVTQRKGRAGRVRSGESFHLFTHNKFNSMLNYSIPEVQRISLTKLILDTKVINDQVSAIDFLKQLPNPPNENAIEQSLFELNNLKMIDDDEKLTNLGKIVATFSLPPKLSKALLFSYLFKCFEPICDIVTLFSTNNDIFIKNFNLEKGCVRELKKQWCADSDHLAYVNILNEWRKKKQDNFKDVVEWCELNYLNPMKLIHIDKLRKLHGEYIRNIEISDLRISRMYEKNNQLILGVLLAGTNNILENRNLVYVKGAYKKSEDFVTEKGSRVHLTADSINYKSNIGNNYLMYINEIHSLIRRASLITETSQITPLTLLLFKNYAINQLQKKSISNEDNTGILKISKKLRMQCDDIEHAKKILEVKFIFAQMIDFILRDLLQKNSSRGEDTKRVYETWDQILYELNQLLDQNSSNKTDIA